MTLNVRTRMGLSGLMLAAILAGCGVAPMATTPTSSKVRAQGKAGDAFALLGYFALDNDLDNGSGLVEELMDQAARSGHTPAAALYDGSRQNDTVNYFQGLKTSLLKSGIAEVDTGNATTLAQFMSFSLPKVGGNRRVLSMADHGGGIVRGICSDWHAPTGKTIIQVPDLASALAKTPVDVLLFDACFMNMAEVAYELKDATEVVVGAETTTRGDFPYTRMVQTLDQSAALSNQDAAKALLRDIAGNASYASAFGAVDTGKVAALAPKVKALVGALNAALPSRKQAIQKAIATAQPYAYETEPGLQMYNNYRDFGDVMEQLKGVGDAAVSQAAADAQAAAKAAVLAESHRSGGMFHKESYDKASGMALYAAVGGPVESRYLTRAWNRDTGWGDFLVKLNGGGAWGPAVAPDKYPNSFPSKR